MTPPSDLYPVAHLPVAIGLEHPNVGWVEVLVDCPGAQGLFTYQQPVGLYLHPGDILSVPFGSQQVGAIAIRLLTHLPRELDPQQIKPVEAVIQPGFFPATYWPILHRVAEYYCTSLMQVIRVALPPGLLARSQRRVRLLPAHLAAPCLPPVPVSATAQQLLTLLQASKTGGYSWQYLRQQIPAASRGLAELLKAGWVEQYLEPPTPVRRKQRQAVSLTTTLASLEELSMRQQEVLQVLKRQGGEMWLAELLQSCQTSSATVKTLAQKGYLAIHAKEVLRLESSPYTATDSPQALTPDQAQALAKLQALSGFAQVLLYGVTGSGKTEVYLQAIAPLLQQGKSALVLVPEIGLTPQLTDRFRARFGDRICVYHSALSDGERYDTWRQMLLGHAQVVIGTRSAVFAPLPNLGLIVLDEEHDSSFKQDQPAPCYHARAVAQWRAQLDDCPLLLGSATPALETWAGVEIAVSAPTPSGQPLGQPPEEALPLNPAAPVLPTLLLSLPTRVGDRPLPTIDVIDMRLELMNGNRSLFSRSLQQTLQTLAQHGQQGILFIPRRGHSTFVSCRSCGYVVTCPHCDVSLTYHQPQAQARPTLRCHYCNHLQIQPSSCPGCDSPYFKHFGSGTQRVTQELEDLFPELRVIRFDSDTTRTKGAHRLLLSRFAEGDADLLVGTQMLTKGLDLPQVTLVGIVAADGLLHFSDYRASERTFQSLTQVAGRCGRGDRPGRVLLQTYSPEHPVIQAVQRQDYVSFAQTEQEQRAALFYPPYGQLILLRFSSSHPAAVQQAASDIAELLKTRLPAEIERLGPAPAPILRIANRYRWQLLLKAPNGVAIPVAALTDLRSHCPSTVSLTLDIDPLNIG